MSMEQLFGSKTRVKLLKLFMSNPDRSFYVREITRKIDEQINSVRRELANLLSLGVIASDNSDSNNKLYYEVDQKYVHYDALKMLFTGKKPKSTAKYESKKDKKAEKSEAKEEKPAKTETTYADQNLWEKAGNISGLLYSGAFTRDNSSPVDIMVVGDVNVAKVEAAITELEKEKNKELRYAVMEVSEWQYRQQVNDRFFSQVVSAKNQVVKDDSDLFIRK